MNPVTRATVTPVAFPDPPLLNAAGVHQPWALRTIVQVRRPRRTRPWGSSHRGGRARTPPPRSRPGARSWSRGIRRGRWRRGSSATSWAGAPEGAFAVVGGDAEASLELVPAPAVRAVGFTGSLAGGRALMDAAAARPDPIPVYAEMGSLNPVFVLPGAAADVAGRMLTERMAEAHAAWLAEAASPPRSSAPGATSTSPARCYRS